ncbi:MAG: ABC transporter substrate-binding protein [Deltaproteobacteria bacterium]|jgi:peptide/nickel transport system substrate-binding protein|nr:ABC transporter substrate-binding protein [Deltaproteobacteria bacterium]
MQSLKLSLASLFPSIEAELPQLPNKLRILGRYVLDHQEQVVFQTIRQLASASGVSEATIMRFVAYFGYEGYSDFLAAVRDFVAERLAATASGGVEVPKSGSSPLEDLETELRGNLVFTQLAGFLASARTILILSSPDAASEAFRLKWLLSRLRPGVTAGDASSCLTEEELETLSDDSLVIVLTLWHSTLELRDISEQVKLKKLPLYLFTFNRASALAEFCSNRVVVLKEDLDYLRLALPLAVNLLAELAAHSLAQRYQDYRQRLDRISLRHQPLSERRDTIQLAIGHELRSLDPGLPHSLMREAMAMRCVFQGLVTFKEGTWEVVPELAESWQVSDDGRSVIFYLRPGVQFHHSFGEFSAKDVKFSFERQTDPQVLTRQPAWEHLEEVVVLSRYAVKLVFSQPCPHLFSSILPMTTGLIVSRSAYEQLGLSQYSTNPVGTGPYAVTAFHPRETLEMERFEDFWGPSPKTSRLVFRLDVHAFNFPYHFNKGHLDAAIFPNVSPQLTKDVPGALVDNRRALQYWWVGLAVDKPPFDRLEVRQAVRLALDRKKIVESGLPGTEPLQTIIPDGVPGHWAEAPHFPYAPEQARRMIAEAGLAPGTKVYLAADPSEIDFAVLEIIRANLVDIGFEVYFEMSNRKVLIEKIQRRQCNLYIFFFNAPQEAYLSLRWFVKGQHYNFSRWENPAYDQLVAQIGRENDENKRLQMIVEAQKIIIDEAWGIWLAQGHNSIIYNSYVDIGRPLPDGFLTPWTMHKKL